MFTVGKKRYSSLKGIRAGVFQHCEFDEAFTIVSPCIFENFDFFNLERGTDLGGSWLVCVVCMPYVLCFWRRRSYHEIHTILINNTHNNYAAHFWSQNTCKNYFKNEFDLNR